MFDELFPGMGLMGMYGMGMPMGGMFSGMQQYRQPGADLFSDLGLMSPQQQMFQGVEMQNMLEQNQLARQQQMMALRNMSMNIGVNAANAGTGFAGPMLMAMGGLQPAWQGGLTQGINGLISKYGPQGQQGGMLPPGVMGATGGVDEAKILDDSLKAAGNDPAKGLSLAANTFSQLADATGNDNYRMAAARARQKAFELQQSEAQSSAITDLKKAQAGESTARQQSLQAGLTKPAPIGEVHDQSGRVAQEYAQYSPASGQWNLGHTSWGTQMQFVLPQTPGDVSKDIGDFRDRLANTEDAVTRIRQVRQGLANGAAQGWTADAVKFANNLQGSLEQLAPGSMLDADGQKLLGTYKGDFNSWAQATGVNESTWADLTMALAKSYAKGGRISNQDIERAKESIGEDYSDPRTVAAILNNVEQRTTGDVDRDYAYLRSSAMMPQQRADIDNLYHTFKQRLTPPTVQPPAGNRPPIGSFYHP